MDRAEGLWTVGGPLWAGLRDPGLCAFPWGTTIRVARDCDVEAHRDKGERAVIVRNSTRTT